MLEIFRTLISLFIPICLLEIITCTGLFELNRVPHIAWNGVRSDGRRARNSLLSAGPCYTQPSTRANEWLEVGSPRGEKKTCGLIDILLTVNMEGRSVIQMFSSVHTAVKSVLQ